MNNISEFEAHRRDEEFDRIADERARRVIHGKTCTKVQHTGTGYLHHEKDDGPYDVDGVNYCGRCHVAL